MSDQVLLIPGISGFNPLFWRPALYLHHRRSVYQDSGFSTPAGIGDPVGGWKNLASSSFNFGQATTSQKATRQTDGVDFDGTDDVLTCTSAPALGPSYSIYFRIRIDDVTDDLDYLLDFDSTNRLIITSQGDVAGQIGYYDGTWRSVAAAATGDQVLSFILDSGGLSGEIFRDGVSLGSGAYTGVSIAADGNRGLMSFNTSASPNASADGALRAALIYDNVVHNAAQRNQIESFLGSLP